MSNAIIKVSNPPRGTGTQPALTFHARECVLTTTWGLQPGTALIDFASVQQQNNFIIPAASIVIEVGGHVFHGVAVEAEAKLGEDGHGLYVEFVDLRYFLQSDDVFGAFNMRDHRVENGRYVRQYRHLGLVAGDVARNIWRTTPEPLTAAEILDLLFANTESPWDRVYHAALSLPVFDIDLQLGAKLGEAVLSISEKVGATFTLQGAAWRLVWAVKGTGALPIYEETGTVFPANSTNRRYGVRVTGNPTRIGIVGDRNLYQVLNITMAPDWLPAWQEFWDVDQLTFDLYDHEADENGTAYAAAGMEGYLRAAERARRITVAEYASLRDLRSPGSGNAYRDYRKIGGRSRMGMPAALYIQYLVFRAFRLPANFAMRFWNGLIVGRTSVDIVEQPLVEVTHNPETGVMDFTLETVTNGNGYAAVRGYQIGQDNFRTLRPEYFHPERWLNLQNIWQHVPFAVDASGDGDQFILFDEPIIATQNLVQKVSINGLTQRYALLFAGATLTVPPVKAALTLAGERWLHVQGGAFQDAVESVPGLSGQFVVASPGGGAAVEVPFADGETATQKSAVIASTLLNRPAYHATGGYTVQGSNTTQLTSMVERVTVKLNPQGGLNEDVQFANEKPHQVDRWGRITLERPRDFERRAQLETVLPGQEALREEANALRGLASRLRKDPRFGHTIAGAFYQLLGYDTPPAPIMVSVPAGPVGTIAAGTPYWREAGALEAVVPGTAMTSPVFVGAAVFEGDRADFPRVTANGIGGVIHVRVQGPASVGETVGYAAATHLVKTTERVVGTMLDNCPESRVYLAAVRLGGTGGGGGTATEYQWFRVTGVFDEHLTCRKCSMNGTITADTTEYRVAKPPDLRVKTFDYQEVHGDVIITYHRTGVQSRTASGNLDGLIIQEDQVIVPPYLPFPSASLIRAEHKSGGFTAVVDGANDTVLDYLDTTPGRAWARRDEA